MTSGDALSALMIGGLMGMIGQSARAAIGLKKMNDMAQSQNLSWQDVFVTSRLVISLIIGFLAGAIAAITLGLDTLATAAPHDMLIKLAAAGYAGTDAIEAFTANLAGTPASKASSVSQSSNSSTPANVGVLSALSAHMDTLNASVASLGGSIAKLASPVPAAPSTGSVDASAVELAKDMQEAKKYLGAILEAAAKHLIAPSLICAIGSRESNWGQGSDMRPKGPAGTGDWAPRNPARWGYAMPPDGLGWGRGLMQVDYAQSDFGKTGNWMDARANILFGADELATNIGHYNANPRDGIDPVRAAVAAYNCGQSNVNRAIEDGFDVDHYTTGHDYSRDVMSRAAWFKAHGFDDTPVVA
jgi:soluble lytic murein transglycosylase-like protein